ncbi:hypothetical protein SESBI_43567 [Sesbania bispinosa]|nr:hypothetical protein SESBI_43567 [Sesbania bispinosa]
MSIFLSSSLEPLAGQFPWHFYLLPPKSCYVQIWRRSLPSLERSLQNCSLNHQTSTEEDGPATDAGIGISSSSHDVADNHISNSDTTLELNSHISLPYHWEQCLDLKVHQFILPFPFFIN